MNWNGKQKKCYDVAVARKKFMARKEEEARKYRKAKLQRVEKKRQRRKNAYKKTLKSAGCTEG